MSEQDKLEALLTDYLDGALSEADRMEVERRLAEDPELAKELSEVRRTMDLLAGLPEMDPPADLISNVLASTCDKATFWSRIMDRIPFERQAPWAAIAAGAIACMVLIVVLTVPDFDSKQPVIPSEEIAFTRLPEKEAKDKDFKGHMAEVKAPAEEEKTGADTVKETAGKSMVEAMDEAVPVPKAQPKAVGGAAGTKSVPKSDIATRGEGSGLADYRSSRAGGGRLDGAEDNLKVAESKKKKEPAKPMPVVESKTAKPAGPATALSEEPPADEDRVRLARTRRGADKSVARRAKIDTLSERSKNGEMTGSSFSSPPAPPPPSPPPPPPSSPPAAGFRANERSAISTGEAGLVEVTPVAAGRELSKGPMDFDSGPQLEALEDVAGAEDEEKPAVVNLAIKERYEGIYSGVSQFSTARVFSLNQWQSLWSRVHSIVDTPKQAPAVDFSRQIVFGIFLGTKPSGGHGVKIRRVEWMDGKVVVTAHVTRPKPGQVTTMALTQPYSIVVVILPGATAISPATPIEFIYE